jgi:cephalosporin hydroxylase
MELLGRGRVIGIDVEIRKYDRLAIQSHPASRRIALIEGSSANTSTLDAVRSRIQPSEPVIVMLESNHPAITFVPNAS